VTNLPRQVGRFEILDRIGSGGMCEVFRARCWDAQGRPRLVAIKRITDELSNDPAVVTMFADEGRLAAKLSHSAIVRLEELGADDRGRAYMVLELVDGLDLRSCLAEAAKARFWLPLAFSLTVVHEVCRALAYAHDATDDDGQPLHLVHRDVSHSNIFLSRRGEVKLADFGVARARGRESHTRAGMVKGKLGYLAPEQVRAEPLDRRTDIFATSVVLWELLTQRRMFAGATEFTTMLAVCTGERASPSTYRAGLPKEVDDLVLRGVAIDREHRYASANEMIAAIEHVASQLGLVLGPEVVESVVQHLAGGDRRSGARAAEEITAEIKPSDAFAATNTESALDMTIEVQKVEPRDAAPSVVRPPSSGSVPSGGFNVTPVRRIVAAASRFPDQPIFVKRDGKAIPAISFLDLLHVIRAPDRTPNDELSADGHSWMPLERFLHLAEIDPGVSLSDPVDPAVWVRASGSDLLGLIGDHALRGFTGRVVIATPEERRACLFERGMMVGMVSGQSNEQLLPAVACEAAATEPLAARWLLGEVIAGGVSLEQAANAVLGVASEAFAKIRLTLTIETVGAAIRLEEKNIFKEATSGWGKRSFYSNTNLELVVPATGVAWAEADLIEALEPHLHKRALTTALLPPIGQMLRLKESARPVVQALRQGLTVSELLASVPDESQRLAQRLLLVFTSTGAVRLR
jgi:serine/threonine protein kinase